MHGVSRIGAEILQISARGTMRLDNEGCLSLSRPECHVLRSPRLSSVCTKCAGRLPALCNFPLVSRSGSLCMRPIGRDSLGSSLASSFRESAGLTLSAFTSRFIVRAISLNTFQVRRVNQSRCHFARTAVIKKESRIAYITLPSPNVCRERESSQLRICRVNRARSVTAGGWLCIYHPRAI